MGIRESVSRTVNKCPCVRKAKEIAAKRAAIRKQREK